MAIGEATGLRGEQEGGSPMPEMREGRIEQLSDKIEGKPTKSEFAEFHPIGTRKEIASLRSRLALLEGLLREAGSLIGDAMDVYGCCDEPGCQCSTCTWQQMATELRPRIAAAIEQKEEQG